ncbi:macrophage mannose receptor 1-like [Diabrotica virgifera virgifera]|uniref:Macrophage mannose receptor 1-like n=1 Tax=Diabrotica virgifera virgifera TaxID=50390 RepID=A0A6P7EXV6_DIAVI|nr:macrophage mannose receptor 1-like [Diabrotica virgifera virgifera]
MHKYIKRERSNCSSYIVLCSASQIHKMTTKVSVILLLCLAILKQNAAEGRKAKTDDLIFFANSEYHIDDTSLRTWEDARKLCQSLDMDLVSIETPEENNFLFESLKKRYGDGAEYSFWTAGVKEGNGWTWTNTGHPIKYFNWAPGQPEDAGARIEMIYNYSAGLRWYGKPKDYGTEGLHAVCELDCDFHC